MFEIFKRFQNRSRAYYYHGVNCSPLDKERLLIRVSLVINNLGQYPIIVQQGRVDIRQILPMPYNGKSDLPYIEGFNEISWPVIKTRELKWGAGDLHIEPGERDTVVCDLIIPARMNTISVYSYLENQTRGGHGWCHTSTERL